MCLGALRTHQNPLNVGSKEKEKSKVLVCFPRKLVLPETTAWCSNNVQLQALGYLGMLKYQKKMQ